MGFICYKSIKVLGSCWLAVSMCSKSICQNKTKTNKNSFLNNFKHLKLVINSLHMYIRALSLRNPKQDIKYFGAMCVWWEIWLFSVVKLQSKWIINRVIVLKQGLCNYGDVTSVFRQAVLAGRDSPSHKDGCAGLPPYPLSCFTEGHTPLPWFV